MDSLLEGRVLNFGQSVQLNASNNGTIEENSAANVCMADI